MSRIASEARQINFNPPRNFEVVSCHLCVLDAHRVHRMNCPDSTPAQPLCLCRNHLTFELYDRYDVQTFLAHLKSRHLEYYERYGDLVKMSLQRRELRGLDKDVWEVQRLIRDAFGMGDDLI